MELPDSLKKLYRHWERHAGVAEQALDARDVFATEKLLEDTSWFIRKRLAIWEKKEKGQSPPYTENPILRRYRFCNIFREFDRQTIESHSFLAPLRNDFPRWLLNMFYCRLVARPQTVHATGLLSFDAEENKKLYQSLIQTPRPRYGTPYVFPVSTILKSSTPTRELFITEHVPKVISAIASRISSWQGRSVHEGVAEILPAFGFNLSFLWTEVLIDVAYQYPERINLFKRFPIGPGALPTFRRIDPHMEPSLLAPKLARIAFDTGLTYGGTALRLSAENWEGIGCEFRKYTNLKEGKGRKRIYHA